MIFVCPNCGTQIPLGREFCGQCGKKLAELIETEKRVSEIEGERKHVTVLFSDLSGYTAMSEKLDPEDLKEITSRIFAEISKVIDKYEGFVEKFVGDAVMALFGVPKAHEDDPVRAIRVAREIHDVANALSPEVEKRIGQPISMHTGINTGLVVTGDVDMERGTHGVAGETINLASRLSSLAKTGEILVGPSTYRQSEGHFTFESLEPTKIKGKTELVKVYKVLSVKERPITIHRLSGLRADLIGRKTEIDQLGEAVENLREGKGRIFSICGDAGTGKSRLVEEFKATLDLEEIQWVEGHAYAYCRNIPYFPMVDMLNRVFHIEEADPQEKIRKKVESGIGNLVENKEEVIPYVGSLYSLGYPEVENVSPEFWQSRLQHATQSIISALARRAPTIFFLEDLHWADPSFGELLRNALLNVRHPTMVICVHRPAFSLFSSHQLSNIAKIYREIQLQDLLPSEAQDMLGSLLKTETIPADLKRFVQDKAEGNPFYLEELVNSLIETEALVRDNGNWRITKSMNEIDISSTIHGVLSSRIDRLANETKRILQEASVIGRAFLYEILKKITDLKQEIDRCLTGLEQLDLIRTRSFQPYLEYMFKHALTQEVVYNGLLKKERKEIHERIGLVMEQLFHDRLPEFYENLAFHFKQGRSIHKAIDYLMKSGEKSLNRYALEEAHQYYNEAYDLLTQKPDRSKEEEELLMDLFFKWALVFLYRGDLRSLTDLLSAHMNSAESLEDKARLGMFYAWLGFAWGMRADCDIAYQYLSKALALGEEVNNQKVICYAHTWLAWIYVNSDMQKALISVERAQETYKLIELDNYPYLNPWDQYLYFKSLAGIGFVSCFAGGAKRAIEAGNALVEYGHKHSNIRSMGVGYMGIASGHLIAGDHKSAIKSYQKADEILTDPFLSNWARCFLGMAQLLDGQLEAAEENTQKVLDYSEKFGTDIPSIAATANLGFISIMKGKFSHGIKMIEESKNASTAFKPFYALFEHALGKVYLQLVKSPEPVSLSTMVKNIGFLIKNIPFASKKAEYHLKKAIEVAKKIGANRILAQAYFDLGLLHQAKKRTDQAKKCISDSIDLFEQCEAAEDLKQAKETLSFLG
jgi:class 3 adenylate cyclase/tetratricopeptide (TPR) repeat protein